MAPYCQHLEENSKTMPFFPKTPVFYFVVIIIAAIVFIFALAKMAKHKRSIDYYEELLCAQEEGEWYLA